MLEHIKLRLKLLKDDIVLVVVMMAMAIVLTMIFGQAFGESNLPSVKIADLDNSRASRKLTETVMDSADGFAFGETGSDEITKLIKENSILAGIIIEEGFETDYSKIKIVSGKSAVETMQLESEVSNAIGLVANTESLSEAVARTLGIEDDIKDDVSDAFDSAYENKSYISEVTAQGESEWSGYNNLMHYVLGFMLFFSTFSMVFVMADILKEKKLHIFQRNLSTPISRASQLLAKMFVTFLLGFAQIVIVLLAGKYLFNIDWGDSLWMLVAISACYILTFTCLGLFLASIVKSYDQLGALSPIILVSTAMLGGCMWPMEIISSEVLLALSRITPQRWALAAMEDIAMRGAPASDAIPAMLVLLGMAAVYFLLGLRVMKKDLV